LNLKRNRVAHPIALLIGADSESHFQVRTRRVLSLLFLNDFLTQRERDSRNNNPERHPLLHGNSSHQILTPQPAKAIMISDG
jgi:hypothetical protein